MYAAEPGLADGGDGADAGDTDATADDADAGDTDATADDADAVSNNSSARC